MAAMIDSIAHPWHSVDPESVEGYLRAYLLAVPFCPVTTSLDADSGLLILRGSYSTSATPPFAFGFVPRTLCGKEVAKLSTADKSDGKALDVFILGEPLIPAVGILVEFTLLGLIPMTVDGCADDKLIGVRPNDPSYGDAHTIADLPRSIIERVSDYLEHCQPDNYVHVGETVGPALARQVFEAARLDYAAKFVTQTRPV